MKNLATLFLCLAFSTPVFCQDAKFEVQVSSDSILLGNYFEIRFKIENVKGNFEPPPFEGFQILSGPNQSTSMQIINGDMTQSASYTYFLKPVEIGNYTIPPAYLIIDEETTKETDPIEIIVVPNPDGIVQKPAQRTPRSLFDVHPGFPFIQDDSLTMPGKKPNKKKKKLKVTKI